MSLQVPAPSLSQPPNVGTALAAEKPITLSCGAVTFADGSSLTAQNAVESAFLTFRQSAGGVREVWDQQDKSWKSAGTAVTPQILFWKDATWQALLVAVGNKDKGGSDTFLSDAATGFPKYAVQCSFAGRDSAGVRQAGASPVSPPVAVLPAGQNNVAGLAMTPNDPAKATEIRLFLKDSTLTERGRVIISQDGAGFHVQLIAGDASVALSSSGEIVIAPANGHAVTVTGDISVSGRVLVGGVPLLVP